MYSSPHFFFFFTKSLCTTVFLFLVASTSSFPKSNPYYSDSKNIQNRVNQVKEQKRIKKEKYLSIESKPQ